MRSRSAAGLFLLATLALLTGAGPSSAQWDDRYPSSGQRFQSPYGGYDYGARQRPSTRYEPRQPHYRAAPARQYSAPQPRLYYYDPRTGTRQTYDPRTADGPSYDPRPAQPTYQQPTIPFFGGSREVARPAPEYREPRRPAYSPPREARRSYEPPPRKVRRYVPAAPSPKSEKPEIAEVEPSVYVAVFGDAMAELVAQGLDTALEDADDVGVEPKTKADASLARPDVYDWPKAIREALSGGPKLKYA